MIEIIWIFKVITVSFFFYINCKKGNKALDYRAQLFEALLA